MPRGATPRQTTSPVRIQDGTGQETAIYNTIIETFIAPMQTQIDALIAAVEALQTMAGFTLATAEVRLRPNGRGGTTYIEPDTRFTDAQIGMPVLIAQASNGDDDEHGIVKFTGEVITTRKLRVRWHAPHGAPKKVNVVYLIGAAS